MRRAGWIALAGLLVAGCSAPPPAPPESACVTTERGPIHFTVCATPKAPRVGDTLTVTLELSGPAGYVLQLPPEDTLAPLEAVLDSSEQARPTDQGVRSQALYRVPLYASGKLEIPPLSARYGQKADGPDTATPEGEIISEPLSIEVASALTSQDSVMTPRDITGTLQPAPRPLTPLEWTLLTVAGLAALGLIWAGLRWLRRRGLRPPPPLAPEVWALQALSALREPDPLDREATRGFFYRLTEIVRMYIEKKFHLAAAEMTTEEFLRALSRDRTAVPYDAGRLEEFLTACDRVKYAAFDPQPEDSRRSIEAARAFVNASAAAASVAQGGQAA